MPFDFAVSFWNVVCTLNSCLFVAESSGSVTVQFLTVSLLHETSLQLWRYDRWLTRSHRYVGHILDSLMLAVWLNWVQMKRHNLGANVNLSSSSSYQESDFCCWNWFASDTHPCWQPHTHTHEHCSCTALQWLIQNWAEVSCNPKKKCFSSKNTAQNANELWYWSCDYNSYLLKTKKSSSNLHVSGWGHNLAAHKNLEWELEMIFTLV